MSTLLAIDIGNTTTSLGVFQGRGLVRTGRLSTRPFRDTEDYADQVLTFLRAARIPPSRITGIAIASVVPQLDLVFKTFSRDLFGKSPFFVTAKARLGIRLRVKNPVQVGADRIVNAVAAYALVKNPAIVVDFGTATTFDCVSKKGEYLGGVIAPGLEVAQEALVARTSRLHKVLLVRPRQTLGRDTVECMQSGLWFGYIGLVEEILRRLQTEMFGRPRVLATGGLARLFSPEIPAIHKVVPSLTLEGLRLLWERNR